MQERAGFDAYGQTLPDWLTYTQITTTIDGQAFTTGQVEQLPQTYYGPSIPLGTGWVYGGMTSPSEALTTSDVQSLSPPISRPTSSLLSSSNMLDAPSVSSSVPPSSFTRPSSTSDSAVSSKASNLSKAISMTVISLPTSDSGTSSSAAFTPNPSTTTPASDGTEFVPLLPALLVPLITLLAVTTLGIWLYRRHKTYQRSTISPSSPPRFIPSFLVSILYPRNGYTPGKTQPLSNPPKRTRVFPLPPSSFEPGLRSPNEKSGLLMGFTPQHHRNSSSISGRIDAGDDVPAESVDPASLQDNSGHPDGTEYTTDNAPPTTSLLQRLTLGLGMFGVGTSEPRKPSGFLLERGFRRVSYAAVPTTLPNIPPPPSHSNSSSGSLTSNHGDLPFRPATDTQPSENSGPTGSSGQDTSSGALRSIPDSQLFYAAPVPTALSRDSSSQAPDSAGLQPWIKSTPQSSHQATRGWREGDEISVGVPETPGTTASHSADGGDLGEFGRRTRWSSGERMRFPVPPNGPAGLTPLAGFGDRWNGQGTFGQGQEEVIRRESMITSDSGGSSYHTPLTEKDLPLIPPVDNPVTLGSPLSRTEEDYRHAALSAFGSTPSTPTQTPLQSMSDGRSSQGHASSPGISSRLLSPKSASPRFALPPLSPFGPALDRDIQAEHPMAGLFTLSPPSSAGIPGEGSEVRKATRTSYQGESISDLTVIGSGIVAPRAMGEFGEPLRPGPDNSPTILVPPGSAPDRSSMTASIYSQPSAAPSLPSAHGTSSSGSSGHGGGLSSPGIRDRALRGKRSQPQLFRASMLSPKGQVEGELPPIPTPPSLTAKVDMDIGEKGARGWFGLRK